MSALFNALGRLVCDWGYRLLRPGVARYYGYELTVLPFTTRDDLYDDDEVDVLLRGTHDAPSVPAPAAHAPQAPQLPPSLYPPLTYCPACLPFGLAAPVGRAPHYCWRHSTGPAVRELSRDRAPFLPIIELPQIELHELREWIITERRANECN